MPQTREYTALAVLIATIAAASCVHADAPDFCRDLDCPKFKVVEQTDDYELRSYAPGAWVTTEVEGLLLETALTTGFKRLYAYITGDNEDKLNINMTVPVRAKVTPGQGPFCKSNFTVSFFVPFAYQNGTAPRPSSDNVYLETTPELKVYVTSFGGFGLTPVVTAKAKNLTDVLERDGKPIEGDHYYFAGYDSPFRLTGRHNEVWVVAKDDAVVMA